ncbi:MAG: hypothetical protein AAF297_07995 [Planctomycetota bacterium]
MRGIQCARAFMVAVVGFAGLASSAIAQGREPRLGSSPESWFDAAALWRTTAWSARVELRSSVTDESGGVPRRIAVTWDAEDRVVTLRASGLRVWATDGRLVVWNPLHAGVVFEVVEEGAAVGGLLARSLPALLVPPLAAAVSNGDLVVGEQLGIEWNDAGPVVGRLEDGSVRVAAELTESAPWVRTVDVLVVPNTVHRLSFDPGGEPTRLPVDLADRTRVPTLKALAGRVGDVQVGEQLPMVSLGLLGTRGDQRGAWPLGAVFAAPGRPVTAVVVFLVPPDVDDAGPGMQIVTELRRTLVRRAVAAGRQAVRFPGIIARPVFVVEPVMYDGVALELAANAWASMPRQPGFAGAESATPHALWSPGAELRDRIAPEAERVIAVVSASGRLDAVVPFEPGGSIEATATALADAIAPDLIPVAID